LAQAFGRDLLEGRLSKPKGGRLHIKR